MRFGVSVEDQRILADERRQHRLLQGPEVNETPPQAVEELDADDGTGTDQPLFVLGLHDMFDTATVRIIT